MRDRSEFAELRVKASIDEGKLVLVPGSDSTLLKFEEILAAGDSCDLWSFMGSKYNDSRMKDLFIGAYFACGGEKYRKEEARVITTDYKGAIKVYLDVNETEDMAARYAVRDFGYFTGGMILLEESAAGRMVFVPKSKCKVCSGPLTRFIELEWKVCNSCHEICEHEYKDGMGQSQGQVVWLSFCRICGRGDPNWEPSEDPFDDTLNVVANAEGLDMLILEHPEGTAFLSKKSQ